MLIYVYIYINYQQETLPTTNPATKKTPNLENVDGSVSPKKVKPIRQHFQVGQSVTAQFDNKGWYLAHVCGFDKGLYTVYFVECGTVKDKLDPAKLRADTSVYPTRADMINKEWFFDGDDEVGPGKWKVRRILHEENTFQCTRLTGEGSNLEKFDVGHVITQYVDQEKHRRNMGWGTVLSSRTRNRRAPDYTR